MSQQELLKKVVEEVDDINQHLKRLRKGDLSKIDDLTLMFAPTGSLQEISISSGWGRDFSTWRVVLTEPSRQYNPSKSVSPRKDIHSIL